MSDLKNQDKGETTSVSAGGTVLHNDVYVHLPSSGVPSSTSISEDKHLRSKAVEPSNDGLHSLPARSNNEVEIKQSPTHRTLYDTKRETNIQDCLKRQASSVGADEDSTDSTSEQHEKRGERKVPSILAGSRSADAAVLTRCTRAHRENPADTRLSLSKQGLCTASPRQTKADGGLNLKQVLGTLTPVGEFPRSSRQHIQVDSKDSRAAEASSAPKYKTLDKSSRCSRPLSAESSMACGQQEDSQRLKKTQPTQKRNQLVAASSAAGPAPVSESTSLGTNSEKKSHTRNRSPQQSNASNSVRRPLVHKLGKSTSTQPHTSTHSLSISRKNSLFKPSDAEKRPTLSHGSTMDSEHASTTSESGRGNEALCQQAVCKRNFIKENAQNACVQHHQRQPKTKRGKPEPPRRHSSFGKIPEYLSQIKSQLQENAKKALDKEAADRLPPGMRLMGNEERLEIVRQLKKEQKEAEQELARMPIAIKTDGQRRRMEYLERRLGELDRAQQKYSKSNLLVEV